MGRRQTMPPKVWWYGVDAMSISSLLCRFFGHKWEWTGMEYREGQTLANSLEASGDAVLVPVTWVHDETCSRCGLESWWPV